MKGKFDLPCRWTVKCPKCGTFHRMDSDRFVSVGLCPRCAAREGRA